MAAPSTADHTTRWIVLSMLAGAIVGMMVWLTFDLFVMFPVFLATGVTVGLAIQSGSDR
jgi:Flp pilus assembly protein TadB